MATSIQTIEGIGPKYAEILSDAGIRNTDQLLKAGASARGRQELANRCELNESLILKWVNMSDLFRVKGVAGQYAELLEAAGVDTVKELRNRNSVNLLEKMGQVNKEKRLVRQLPSDASVTGWIEHAKELEPMVTH
jgi:predicted flap endonuclease-1-like 5' DNA nuclease